MSNNLLFHTYIRLSEVVGSVINEPFAGISVIVGNFFQLPPIGRRLVLDKHKNDWQNFEFLRKIF